MATVGPVPVGCVPMLSNCLLSSRSSTDYNADHGVKNILLNYTNDKATSRDGAESWCASILDKNQFVVFGGQEVKDVVAFSIQGRGDYDQWVTSFRIRYSMDNVTWTEFNNKQILPGNSDRNTIVTYVFNAPIKCRSIAIHPETWSTHISMRCEVYCKPALPQSFVQIGTVQIGDRSINSGTGERKAVRPVVFPTPFTATPKIAIGTNLLDSSADGIQTRYRVEAQNVTTTGFDCVFYTWASSQVYECKVDYVAIQNQ